MSNSGNTGDDGWTPLRRRSLGAVAEHFAPPPSGETDDAEDLASQIIAKLAETRFAGQAIFIQALLDELRERAGGELGAAGGAGALETALRAVEAGDDPYLGHALRLLLRLSLESRYAARTTEPLDARS